MSKKIVKRVLAGLLFASALIIALMNQSTIITVARDTISGSSETAPLAETSAEQSGGAQAENNPFVAAIEKKIAGQENKPAEEVFKNIKLLKGMPAVRVLRVMQTAFSGSLGVDCSHCHVPDAWEKDDKEAKQTARKMWSFMGKVNQDLIQTIGKGTVNCTTCHRGQVKPATNMPAAK